MTLIWLSLGFIAGTFFGVFVVALCQAGATRAPSPRRIEAVGTTVPAVIAQRAEAGTPGAATAMRSGRSRSG